MADIDVISPYLPYVANVFFEFKTDDFCDCLAIIII